MKNIYAHIVYTIHISWDFIIIIIIMRYKYHIDKISNQSEIVYIWLHKTDYIWTY